MHLIPLSTDDVFINNDGDDDNAEDDGVDKMELLVNIVLLLLLLQPIAEDELTIRCLGSKLVIADDRTET
jgi:hypothetical protein